MVKFLVLHATPHTQSKPYTIGTALLSDAVSNSSLLALVCHIPCQGLCEAQVLPTSCRSHHMLSSLLTKVGGGGGGGGGGAGKQTSLQPHVGHKVSMYCNHLQMMVDLHNPFFVSTFQYTLHVLSSLAFFTKRDASFPYQTLHASHI